MKIAIATLAAVAALPMAGTARADVPDPPFVPGELLVQFEPGASRGESRRLAREAGAEVVDRFSIVPNLTLIELPSEVGVREGDRQFSSLEQVAQAQPNFVQQLAATPNDTHFGELWALENGGQTVNATTGLADADIDALEAWVLATGSPNVKVAVIDSGLALEHPDLTGNLWRNPGEFGGVSGTDDDFNGYVDDVNGYDFVEDDETPDDGNGHGTHVAGIIGAEGDNATGVTGVNWNTRLMALKAGDADGKLTSANVIKAIEYADARGADVVNESFTGTSFDSLQRDAMLAASETLFVAAAGNDGIDVDASPRYPCSFDLGNLICVGASNQFDTLASFSNFGDASVDLAAPGTNTLSAVPTYSDEFSDDFEGTLMWSLDGSLDIPPATGAWALTDTDPESALGLFSPITTLTDSPGADYVPDTDSWARLAAPLDLTGLDACSARFGLYYDLGSGDLLKVEGSDDGSAWQQLLAITGTGPALGQTRVLDLAEFSGSGSFHLRFRLLSDSDASVGDGVHIDDVKVQCEDAAAESYDFKQGTSMAAPQVAGAAALLLDQFPSYTVGDMRTALLANVDTKALLDNKVVSGGRLNLGRALEVGVPGPPPDQNATDPPTVTKPKCKKPKRLVKGRCKKPRKKPRKKKTL
jgi:subtilisin family serine protease